MWGEGMGRTRRMTITQGDVSLFLEVNPEEVKLSYPQNYKTKELIGGEYVQMGARGVRKVEIKTFFPHKESLFKYSRLQMDQYWNYLRRWMDKHEKVVLHIVGFTKGPFYIIELTRTAIEGDKDMSVSISLLEYIDIQERRVKKNSNGDQGKKSRLLKRKSPMMKGEDVEALQKALHKAGYESTVGKIDGIFGKRTEKGVRAFQKAKKLVVDGIAGPKTFKALGLKWIS